jgi:hypothetical protein
MCIKQYWTAKKIVLEFREFQPGTSKDVTRFYIKRHDNFLALY